VNILFGSQPFTGEDVEDRLAELEHFQDDPDAKHEESVLLEILDKAERLFNKETVGYLTFIREDLLEDHLIDKYEPFQHVNWSDATEEAINNWPQIATYLDTYYLDVN
jgi:hypothetical protein